MFLFTFGTFPVLAVAGLDAQANRFAWTEAALTHPQTMVVFDDDDIDPCSEPTVLVTSCQASFSGNGATLFSFEDLSRQGWSEMDYSDLVFVLDFPALDEVAFVANESQETREEPPPSSSVPAPSSLGLLLIGLPLGAWRRIAA